MKKLLFLCLLYAAPVYAQVEIVAAVKNDLVARHVSLSGPCGAFEITKRVAWALRAQGFGLLSKPGGNNCQGYSVDYLVRPDASGIDILGDAGGENSPGWSESEPPGALAGRWMAPFDPGDAAVPPPPPQSSTTDARLSNIESVLSFDAEILKMLVEEMRAHEAKEAEFREQVRSAWRDRFVFAGKYIMPILGAIFAGRATK